MAPRARGSCLSGASTSGCVPSRPRGGRRLGLASRRRRTFRLASKDAANPTTQQVHEKEGEAGPGDGPGAGPGDGEVKRRSVFSDLLPHLYEEEEGGEERREGGKERAVGGKGKRKSVFSGLLPQLYDDEEEGEEEGEGVGEEELEEELDEELEEEDESFDRRLRSALREIGLVLEEKVGEGSVADIYAAREAEGGVRAVKVLRKEFRKRKKARDLFRTEAKIAVQLNHPNVVKVYHYDGNLHFMVQEYCEGGSLYSLLAAQRSGETLFPILDAPQIAKDLAKALSYLHKAGVVHRDVKSLNVLLGADPSTGKRRAKICDFGSALLLSSLPEKYYFKPITQVADNGNKNLFSKLANDLVDSVIGGPDEGKNAFEAVGTPYWMAPEMLDPKVLDRMKLKCEQESGFVDALKEQALRENPEEVEIEIKPCLDLRAVTKTLDVYSFGVVLYELFHRAHPWFEEETSVATREEVRKLIVDEEKRLPLADYLCQEIKDLISQCWSSDAYERPAMERVYKDLLLIERFDLSGSIDVAANVAKFHLLKPDGQRIYLADQEKTSLGRSPDCSLVLEGSKVSRQHAVIRFVSEAKSGVEIEKSQNGKYMLVKSGEEKPYYFVITDTSMNGTYLNRRPLVKNKPRRLVDGDKIIMNFEVVATFVAA